MHVVEIEIIGIETLQALVDCAADGGARQAFLIRRVADLVGHLACQDHSMTAPFERAAKERLGRAFGIYVGSVEKINAIFEAALDHANSGRFAGLAAESHGAEAEAGTFKVGFRKGDQIHEVRISNEGTLRL